VGRVRASVCWLPSNLSLARVISSTLKMVATRSSETSVLATSVRCHIPDDGILHDEFLFKGREGVSAEYVSFISVHPVTPSRRL
jgi:hypothetical protein